VPRDQRRAGSRKRWRQRRRGTPARTASSAHEPRFERSGRDSSERYHMKTRILLLSAKALLTVFLADVATAQSSPRALIDSVAKRMGGAQAILGVRTLEANGYGMEAYFWGGGNITGDPDAAQKWAENPNMASIWDFENDRYLTKYRHNFMFPFGGLFGHSFALSAWGVDGDVGYTIPADGNPQRLPAWTTLGAYGKPDGAVFRV